MAIKKETVEALDRLKATQPQNVDRNKYGALLLWMDDHADDIRAALKELSQAELSKVIGVHSGQVSYWLNSRSKRKPEPKASEQAAVEETPVTFEPPVTVEGPRAVEPSEPELSEQVKRDIRAMGTAEAWKVWKGRISIQRWAGFVGSVKAEASKPKALLEKKDQALQVAIKDRDDLLALCMLQQREIHRQRAVNEALLTTLRIHVETTIEALRKGAANVPS